MRGRDLGGGSREERRGGHVEAPVMTAMKAWSALDGQGQPPRSRAGDGKKTLCVALLVFVSCSLVLTLTKAHRHLSPPRPEKPSPAAARNGVRREVEPVGFVLSRVEMVAMVYLSAAACGGNREGAVSRARRTWKRPATTLLCVELLATASSSLLWTLAAFARATDSAAAETLFLTATAGLAAWLGPVLFAHSEIACKLSLVVSLAEEGCEGMEALRRAGELVEGRKLQGLVLTTLLTQLEQAPAAMLRYGGREGEWMGRAMANAAAGSFLVTALHLLLKFLSYMAYTMFYHQCNRSHGKE